MRKLLAILALGAVVTAALPATSQAAVTWPASCKTMICVNAHLNNLDARARAHAATQVNTINNLRATITALTNRVDSQGARWACVGSRDLFRDYSYDYYGDLFLFMDTSSSSGQGNSSGPYTFMTNTCA